VFSRAIRTTGGGIRAKRSESGRVTRTSPWVAACASCRTFNRTPVKSAATRVATTAPHNTATNSTLTKTTRRVRSAGLDVIASEYILADWPEH
jgi:hypothetical protein